MRGAYLLRHMAPVSLIIAALAIIGERSPAASDQTGTFGLFFDERGEPIKSIFAGMPSSRDPNMLTSRLSATEACTRPATTLSNQRSSDGRYSAAQWVNCWPGGCYGSYFISETKECPPACFGFFNSFYSDATLGKPNDGWQYTGLEVCFYCGVCKEQACESQGPG